MELVKEPPREAWSLRDFFCRGVLRKLKIGLRARRSSARDAETYRLLVSGVGARAILTLDPQGNVTSWNAGARQIKGYESAEIIGRHFSCFYAPEAIAAERPQCLLQAARDRGWVEDEGWRIRKDGSRFWAAVLVTRLSNGAGALIGYSKITRDITAQHLREEALSQSEERLRRRSDALQGTLKRMQESIAMASHELRNPLLPIRTAAALLARRRMDPDTDDLLQTVEDQSALLARFVEDLVDTTRIDWAGLSVRRARVSLRDVLHRAVEAARPEMERRGHHLSTAFPQEDAFLFADPARLFQVFVNLLNNAARYSPSGGNIRTVVDLARSHVVVRVEDDGYGIAPENLRSIFEPFMRGAVADQAAPEGMGLGLAVVQRLVQLHGGEVVAESAGLGQGSRFSVTLPRSEEGPVVPASQADSPHGTRPLRILCVDDNEQVARSLVKLLRAMGQESEMALDGESALLLASSWNPELVLLDISMPGMDGGEVASQLLARSQGASPTVVALTGWAQDDDESRARAGGFHHYVMKPVTAETLESAITLARQRLR